MITLAEYYIANKEPDSDWAIIPRTNISAYLGSAKYMESYENKISDEFMEKKPDFWLCSCGNNNNGNFCTECGKPKNN